MSQFFVFLLIIEKEREKCIRYTLLQQNQFVSDPSLTWNVKALECVGHLNLLVRLFG